MRENSLTFLSVIAIALLVILQAVWVHQLIQRDKERFEMELKQTLQSVVSFSLSKEVSGNLNELSFELTPINPNEIPSNAIVKGSFDTKEYQSGKNLGNFLVGVFAEDLLNENKIPLEPMDSIFSKEFRHYDEIAAYGMRIQKRDSVLREIYGGEKPQSILKHTLGGVTVKIPIGKTNTYMYTAHVVFKPTIFTQRLRSLAVLSAIAVILISLVLLNQLKQFRKKTNEQEEHKKAVRGIIHDLKSPLAYIFTMLDSFENVENDEIRKTKYITGKVRVKHLSEKIEILLTTLKSNKNNLHIELKTYNITSRSKEIIDELKVIYRTKNIRYTIQPEKDVIIKADQVYFEGCLRNLLDNAVKYGSNDVVIDVSVILKDNKLYLSITDNGKGISENDQKKIFREFYCSNTDSTLKNHGIGLAFSKQIVQAHHGKLLLESALGQGSKFTIILPQ